eukprot:gene8172-9048_t
MSKHLVTDARRRSCNKLTEVGCANGKGCIHKSWKCDGEEDCLDGSDERGCKFAKCPEFQCKNRKCISNSRRCDQFDDCGDYSDEVGCSRAPSLDCSSGNVFKCSGGKTCIDKIRVCDGKKDCPQGDDEPANCGVNECSTNNAGCTQICADLKIGFQCSCRDGFKLNSDGKTCDDINECETYGTCSQHCKNSLGSYKCSCQKGYTLKKDGRSCRVQGGRPSLVIANRMNIIQMDTDSNKIKSLVPAKLIGGVLAVDINIDGYLYWADYVKGRINRVKVNTTDKIQSLINGKLTKAEGIAVDWIGNKLYWTNTEKQCVEVSNLDGSYRKVLVSSDVDKPRGIALAPSQRLMFWTDWGKEPKIERASMDGADRKTIIHSDNLQWPNAVTVDHVSQRLYWVDRRKGYLGSSTFEGDDVRRVVTSNVQWSFGLAVFEDYVYWTQNTGKVFKADKTDGEHVKELQGAFFSPYMIQVYHPAAKPKGPNPCGSNNGGCAQLCLLGTSAKKYSCACADGYQLAADGKTCA